MTAQWALEHLEAGEDKPLAAVAAEVARRFAPGSASPDELPRLNSFYEALLRGVPMASLEQELRGLSHQGYLRAALVAMAAALERRARADVALTLARELLDAIDPELGVRVAQAVLTMPDVDEHRSRPDSSFVLANRLLGETALERDNPQAALRHFEAVLAIDVHDVRALRGWSEATRRLERRGVVVEHRSRGLALLDGVDELDVSVGFGNERYELGRPLGRGRHAVVYQAYDRHVGREVAIKRLLDAPSGSASTPRILEARFFSEAKTLARVRSPHVVALYDVQPRQRFIALELCRGGNLRLALRRRLVGPDDLDRIGGQLHAALTAVHCAGAVHRDIKPANVLVREAKRGSSVALADFGLAQPDPHASSKRRAGTLRYLAPELRQSKISASPQTDHYAVGVLLLEVARAPAPLPDEFDRLDGVRDPSIFIPEQVSPVWRERLSRLLDPDPQERGW